MKEPPCTKNYILCHVRRVVGRQNDDDDDGTLKTQQQSSKIPNKIQKAPQLHQEPAGMVQAAEPRQSQHSAHGATTRSDQGGHLGGNKPLSAYKQKKLQQEQGLKPPPGRRGRKRHNATGVDSVASNLQKESLAQSFVSHK